MSIKLTTEQVIERFRKKHGDAYDYSRVEYKAAKLKVEIICRVHGSFLQTPDTHYVSGCSKCGWIKSGKGSAKSHEDFISEASKKHNNFYDYSKTQYTIGRNKIVVTCPNHGDFTINADNHLIGASCRKCSKESIRKLKLKTTDQFITDAVRVHRNTYNYSKVEYTGDKNKVIVICKKHGEFSIGASCHLQGSGCTPCGIAKRSKRQMKSTPDFIMEANEKHGGRYEYHKTIYLGAHRKVTITCPIHGDFDQTPRNHLNGNGCKQCTVPNRKSMVASRWLDRMGVTVREYQLPENLRLFVDGYCPRTNTVYEFHGDYWHGNPDRYNRDDVNQTTGKTYGQLYDRTRMIENEILSYGYCLVTIWEKDFRGSE